MKIARLGVNLLYLYLSTSCEKGPGDFIMAGGGLYDIQLFHFHYSQKFVRL